MGGTALQRQGVELLGIGFGGIARQPGRELGIARVVRLARVALGEDMAEQQPVLQAGDLVVGLAPGAALLQREDALVAGDLGRRQDRRHINLAEHFRAGRQRGGPEVFGPSLT